MTNPNSTLIAVLLDRSGSMSTIKDDTEGGFDTYIANQRTQPGEATVSLAQFDTDFEWVFRGTPVADVPALNLEPRGATALYDAIGRLSTEVGATLAAQHEDERPGSVVVVVLTDGHENSSREWTHDAVRALIERQEEQYSWDYLFLGANMDAVEVGRSMGFKTEKSITYATSKAGVDAVFSAASAYTSRKRMSPMSAPAGFSDQDRANAARTE